MSELNFNNWKQKETQLRLQAKYKSRFDCQTELNVFVNKSTFSGRDNVIIFLICLCGQIRIANAVPDPNGLDVQVQLLCQAPMALSGAQCGTFFVCVLGGWGGGD